MGSAGLFFMVYLCEMGLELGFDKSLISLIFSA